VVGAAISPERLDGGTGLGDPHLLDHAESGFRGGRRIGWRIREWSRLRINHHDLERGVLRQHEILIAGNPVQLEVRLPVRLGHPLSAGRNAGALALLSHALLESGELALVRDLRDFRDGDVREARMG